MTLGSPYNLSLSLYSPSRFENHKSRIKFLTKPYDNFNSYPLLETGEVGRRIIGEDSGRSEKRCAARDLEDVPTPSCLQNLLLHGWYLRQSPLNCAQKYLPARLHLVVTTSGSSTLLLLQRAIYFGASPLAAHTPSSSGKNKVLCI